MADSGVIAVLVIGVMLGVASAVILRQGYNAAPEHPQYQRLDWLTDKRAAKHVFTGLLMLASCFLLVSFSLCVPQDWT